MSSATPTVFLVDDDEAVRDSLALLLNSMGYATAGYATAQQFLSDFRPDRPGCLIADVRMPGMSGLELQAHLAAQGVILPVIVITGHGDVAMAVAALKSGAADFIEKPFDDQALIASVRHALDRDRALRQARMEIAVLQARLDQLTPREKEVMERVVAGDLNKVIAARMGISARTVEIHRARVMEKMGAQSLSELVRMALRLEAG